MALRAGGGRPRADFVPCAVTLWLPHQLWHVCLSTVPGSPCAPPASVQVSLRDPGRPLGPGPRLADRWKVPGGPLRDSPPQSGAGGAFTVWTVCRPSRESVSSDLSPLRTGGHGKATALVSGARR